MPKNASFTTKRLIYSGSSLLYIEVFEMESVEEAASSEGAIEAGPLLDGSIKKVSALPKKHILASAAKSGYEKDQALAEMVDNSLDELRNADGTYNPGSYASISINIGEGQTSHLILDDNAGGVSKEKFSRLISLGDTNKKFKNDLGVFGVGGKKGMLSLGELVTVCSRVPGEEGVCVVIDEDWLESDGWEIDLREAPDVKEGHTTYLIRRLRTHWEEEDIDTIIESFRVRYGLLLNKYGENLKILINDVEVTPVDDIKFIEDEIAPSEKFKPFEKEFILGGGDRTLFCKMKVGLMIEGSIKGEYGADIYCNDRLLVRFDKIAFKPRGKIGNPHTMKSRLRARVELDGPGIHMPWNDSKNKLDKSNPLFKELEDDLENAYFPYKKLVTSSSHSQITKTLYEHIQGLRESKKVPARKLPKIRVSTAKDKETEGKEDDIPEIKPRPKEKSEPDEDLLFVGAQIEPELFFRVAKNLGVKSSTNAEIVRQCFKFADKTFKKPKLVLKKKKVKK